MTGGELVPLVTVLLGSGTLGALVTWRLNRHKPRIDRAVAEQSTEKVRSEIRTADIDGLRDIIEALREDQDRARSEITELRARVEQAEARADRAEIQAAEDAAYIEDLLAQWPDPPPPARRAHHTSW